MILNQILNRPEILFFIPVFILCRIFSIKHKECELHNPKSTAILSIFVIIGSNILVVFYLLVLNKYKHIFDSINSIVLIFSSQLFINIPVILALIYKKEPLSSIGISKHNLFKSIIIGFALSIGFIFFLASSLGNLHDINTFIFTKKSLNEFIYFTAVGFGEEFMYRGYFQTRICSFIGKWRGLLISSVMMALIHIPLACIMGNENLYSAFVKSLSLIPVSLLFGYIMMKTQNLAAPAIFHTFIDWSYTILN